MLKYFLIAIFMVQSTFAFTANGYMEGIKLAKEGNKKLLLMVSSEYCGWCKKMKNTTLKNPDVVSAINKNFIFVEIDKAKGQYPRNLRVGGVPSFFIISPKNELLDNFMGYQKKDRFLTHLRDNIK